MKARNKHTPPPINTRADARRLFPAWSRTMQARWVLSRLRLRAGKWAHPERLLSREYVDDGAPDFLRRLPPHQFVSVTPTARDHVSAGLRYVKRLIHA